MISCRWLILVLGLMLAVWGCDGGGVMLDDDTADDDDTGDDDTGDDDTGDDDTVDPNDMDGDGYSVDDGDCDDLDPGAYPGAEEIPYDGIDQDCNGSDVTDVDGDGYDADWFGGEDCNDSDGTISPAMTEICGDGVDRDCTGSPDDGTTDADGDGYIDWACTDGTDCDDSDGSIHPEMEVAVPDDYADVASAADAVCTDSQINVSAGSYNGNIEGENKSLMIIGLDGAETTTLVGDGNGSVVVLGGDGGQSGLNGFTVTGGNANDGGGLMCYGDCVVQESVFTGNEAFFGGAIKFVDGTIAVSGSNFHDNQAEWGGCVHIDNAVGAMSNSEFDSCSSTSGGGALSIWNTDITLSNLDVTNNESMQAGGIFLYTCTGSISDTRAEGNVAETAGALFTRDSTIDLLDNTLTGNHGEWGGGGYYCWDTTVTSLETNDISSNTDGGDCDDYVSPPCNDLACRTCNGC